MLLVTNHHFTVCHLSVGGHMSTLNVFHVSSIIYSVLINKLSSITIHAYTYISIL